MISNPDYTPWYQTAFTSARDYIRNFEFPSFTYRGVPVVPDGGGSGVPTDFNYGDQPEFQMPTTYDFDDPSLFSPSRGPADMSGRPSESSDNVFDEIIGPLITRTLAPGGGTPGGGTTSGGTPGGGFFDDILSTLFYTGGKFDPVKAGGIGALGASLLGILPTSRPQQPQGYQGGIPSYTAVRSRVPGAFDPNRRPGSGGQRYFSDVQFVPEGGGIADAQALTDEQAMGLAALNKASPFSYPVQTMNTGGLLGLKEGMYLDGATDGMADEIPAMIDGEQPAMLSDGEFVIPADVVSHLGNGNSDAGAKELEGMMDNVRMARTGTKKQAPEIDPQDFLPTGEMA
jgi:hypothetical protein|tara:strand:+ start:125 stop:1153 length:1029 start_codon:yes stop_codon:yes gene_type:complete